MQHLEPAQRHAQPYERLPCRRGVVDELSVLVGTRHIALIRYTIAVEVDGHPRGRIGGPGLRDDLRHGSDLDVAEVAHIGVFTLVVNVADRVVHRP